MVTFAHIDLSKSNYNHALLQFKNKLQKQQQQQKSDILISLTLGPNPHSDFISSKVAGCRMKVFSDVKTEGCQKHSKLVIRFIKIPTMAKVIFSTKVSYNFQFNFALRCKFYRMDLHLENQTAHTNRDCDTQLAVSGKDE